MHETEPATDGCIACTLTHAAGWSELGRQGREEGLEDGELQRRQQQHPAADVGPRQPHLALRRARPLPKGHGRAIWCVFYYTIFPLRQYVVINY